MINISKYVLEHYKKELKKLEGSNEDDILISDAFQRLGTALFYNGSLKQAIIYLENSIQKKFLERKPIYDLVYIQTLVFFLLS
jgi:hypothetical protein